MELKFRQTKYTTFRERWVPTSPGLYRILIDERIRYIGKAKNLKRRYVDHLQTTEHNLALFKAMQKSKNIEFQFIIVPVANKLSELEQLQIKRFGPQLFNIQYNN